MTALLPSDFRSDTVTKPTDSMRRAMATAEVGDDVFGEDPTVNRLERMAADLFGKEKGLFVASGTMANQVAVRAQTSPGDEVVVEARSHIYDYELGALAALSGVQARPVQSEGGILEVADVARAIKKPGAAPTAATSLLVLENTHNSHGGRVVPLPRLKALYELATSADLAVHLDGARIFNAAVAHDTPEHAFGEVCHTLSFSLCKGLSAPVGAVLVGPAETIDRARRVRKMFGGGMRQAGILAAAGIVALEEMVDRLREDHALAEALGARFHRMPGVTNLRPVETNIVVFDLAGEDGIAPRVEKELAQRGVLAFALGPRTMRFVTHKDVGPEDAERAVATLREILD
ncbi:MAG: DegT/DnrJ/EryC1/StrS family aminotransferase [Planctomycetes bacterium]|nr:DegT/DnrJ/EryC1/StrS family aminotransferase [Planctomycetota bacterium]